MTDATTDDPVRIDRRKIFGGVIGLGVALPVLAACGSGSDDSGASDSSDSSGSSSDSSDSGDSGDSGESSGDGFSTPTADVPVGSGTIYDDEKVVVTQPEEGDFKAFGATCPHRGCLVSQIDDTGILCTCHGSKFDLSDGSVLEGPAEEGLPEMTATVDGDNVAVS